MLMVTPQTALALRPTRRERDAARRRLSKERAQEIVGTLCAVTRHAMDEGVIVTPLNCEAVYRRTVRAALCLQGWPWADADQTALDLVAVAFAILQVERPSWNEGQPEYVVKPGTLIRRTRCANCGNRLPEDRLRFCSDGCRKVYHLRLLRLREASEEQMATLASRSPL